MCFGMQSTRTLNHMHIFPTCLHCPFMYSQCMSLTPNSLGHFGDVTKANLLAWYGKTKPDTTKPGIYQSKEMYTMSQKTSHLWLAITLTHMNGF